MSLGIICYQKYNPALHAGQKLIHDPIDGQMYAERRIDWFVKEGQAIEKEVISHPFFRNISPAKAREPWVDEIAISHQPISKLPKSMFEGRPSPLKTRWLDSLADVH